MIILFSSDPHLKTIYDNLNEAGFNISALVTQPPKPKGRKLEIIKNTAHLFAQKKNLKVLSPNSIDEKFTTELAKLNPKIGVLYAYGKMLPAKVLDIFNYGVINLHPSLLPKYRGPSPIQTAILNGDSETGYSVIRLSSKMDAGEILFQEKINIKPDDTFTTLKDKIIVKASQKLPKVLEKYLEKQIIPKKQTGVATYCRIIKKGDGDITSRDTANSAYNKYRAFTEWPGTRIITSQTPITIKKAEYNHGKIKLIKVQIPGKKVIDFDAFKNGYPKLLTELPNFVII